MSCHRQESSRPRTSQRMRLKMLKNLNEYKIANPYRKQASSLPDQLHLQLKKIQHLSSTSINLIRLASAPPQSQTTKAQLSLLQMNRALEQQENRFRGYFGQGVLDYQELEQEEHYSGSEVGPTHPSQADPLHRDEIHMNYYEDRSILHENLFEFGGIQEEKMEEEAGGDIVVEEDIGMQDFEQYFVN